MLRSYVCGAAATALFAMDKVSMRINHDYLKCILNLAGATGLLAQWRLRFTEYDFDIFHRAGIKRKAAGVLSRRVIGSQHYTDINGDISVTVITPIHDFVEAREASSYRLCQICDSSAHEPGKMMPKVQSFFQEQDPNWDKVPRLAEFIAAQARDLICHQCTVSVGHPIPNFYVDSNGRIMRQFTVDATIQTVVPKSL